MPASMWGRALSHSDPSALSRVTAWGATAWMQGWNSLGMRGAPWEQGEEPDVAGRGGTSAAAGQRGVCV